MTKPSESKTIKITTKEQAAQAARFAGAAYHPAGKSLYLRTSLTKPPRWVYRYRRNGKLIDEWLGDYGPPTTTKPKVTLKDATIAAGDFRAKLRLMSPEQASAETASANAPAITFSVDTEAYIRLCQGEWSARHAAIWKGSMTKHVMPTLGSMTTAAITAKDIDRVLNADPVSGLWTVHNETALRLHGRIRSVIDMAMHNRPAEFIRGNPAHGMLKYGLPRGMRPREVEHPAVPWQDAPALYARLAGMPDYPAKALCFLMLCCAPRAGEILGAEWSMIHDAVYYVPARLIKGGKRPPYDRGRPIPLVKAAIELLDSFGPERGKYVFAGREGKEANGVWVPFSGKMHGDAMQTLLRSLPTDPANPDGATLPWHVHGMRATFRTWMTAQRPSLCEDRAAEAAQARVIRGEEVRQRYDRDQLMTERREIAERWSTYLTGSEPTD